MITNPKDRAADILIMKNNDKALAMVYVLSQLKKGQQKDYWEKVKTELELKSKG